MVPRFLGFAQFERNCKMLDPQKVSILVHLCRGLLVKAAVQHFSYCTEMMTQFVTFCENLGDKKYF